MRARLSERYMRDFDPRCAWFPSGHIGAVRDRQRVALDEACAILTEAEPEDPHASGHYSPCDGYRYMEGCWIGSPGDGNAQAALAESLSAFVAEPMSDRAMVAAFGPARLADGTAVNPDGSILRRS